MADADAREPDWLPLVSEFIVHAARDDELRQALVGTRERFLAAIAGLIDDTRESYGLAYRVPALDIARGSSVLARGFAAERLLDPAAVPPELFVELHAYLRGLALPAERGTS